MVVDANPDSLAAQYGELTERGFRVATYLSPVSACGYAAEEKPDVILMSCEYPECDGLSAVRRLKEASPRSHILLKVGPGQRSMFGEAALAGAELVDPGASVLQRLEEAIGELSAPAGR